MLWCCEAGLRDIDLAASIAAALHSDLGATGITVCVSYGSVTLEGLAETEEQRTVAEAIAGRLCARVTSAVRLG